MQDGIYQVRFSFSTGSSTEGIIVIKKDQRYEQDSQFYLNGGDAVNIYAGIIYISDNGKLFTGILNVKKWNLGHDSIFDSIGDFPIRLNDEVQTENSFSTSVQLGAETITIAFNFLSELSETFKRDGTFTKYWQ
jgi:hypothetical protein